MKDWHYGRRQTDYLQQVVVFVDEANTEKVERDASETPVGTSGRCLALRNGSCDHWCGDIRIVEMYGSMRISPIIAIEPKKKI